MADLKIEENVNNSVNISLTNNSSKYDFDNVVISLENCIIPEEKLYSTPSMSDGLSYEHEIELRILGCELIQVSGILLRLPQVRNF